MKHFNTLLRACALTTATLLPLSAQALNYNFIEGGVVDIDRRAGDDTGLRLAGSAGVAPQFALIGEYVDVDQYEQLSAGGLFHTPLSRHVDLNLGATLESVENGPRDDTGFGLRGGVRWLVPGTRLELNPGFRHVDVFDNDSTSLRLGGLFSLTSRFELQAAIQSGDDDRVEFGARYHFTPIR